MVCDLLSALKTGRVTQRCIELSVQPENLFGVGTTPRISLESICEKNNPV